MTLSRMSLSRWALPAFYASVVAPALWGCNSHPLETPKPLPEQQADKFIDLNPSRELDLIFMIDNSGSMREEQENLKNNFKVLIDELKKIPGGLPNVHIGIVSSDVGAGGTLITGNPACNRPGGDRGAFQVKAGCGLDPAMGRFLISDQSSGAAQKNFTGELEDVFACMASIGTLGCGYEHQLQAARLALAANVNPENSGFLREDALLGVIFITDEDDCSGHPQSDLYADTTFTGMQASLRCGLTGHRCGNQAPPRMPFSATFSECRAANANEIETHTYKDANDMNRDKTTTRLYPVEEFIQFFQTIKGRADKVIVAAIAGWPDRPDEANTKYAINEVDDATGGGGTKLLDVEPACVSAGGKAAPAMRLRKFIDSFGSNGSFHSICTDNFGPALKRIGELIATKIGDDCLAYALVDRDLTKPGVQAECSVVDRVPTGATGFEDRPIPECSKVGDKPPCWVLEAGGAGQKCDAGKYRVQVQRAGEPTKDSQLAVKCLACVSGPGKGNTGCPCAADGDCAAGMKCTADNTCAPPK